MLVKDATLFALISLVAGGAHGFVATQGSRLLPGHVRRLGMTTFKNANMGEDRTTTTSDPNLSRRKAFSKVFGTVAAASLLSTTTLALPAQAYYDKNYPEELVVVDDDDVLDGRSRRKEQIMEKEAGSVSAVTLGPQYKPISAVLWGSALWLLSGSRSNPVATPLANLLYNEKEEKWLKDRNEGLFATLPVPLLIILAVVFVGLGWGADSLIVLLADGDRNISLQLAGVSIISGASLELGRIASGEKAPTRDEADRDGQLESEFAEFAEKRLQPGGNCHRSEVVRAFRRYFAKYRQADSEEYPLTDLEVERLLKAYSARMPNVEMTSAGFYYGIQINKDADVFA